MRTHAAFSLCNPFRNFEVIQHVEAYVYSHSSVLYVVVQRKPNHHYWQVSMAWNFNVHYVNVIVYLFLKIDVHNAFFV